jgi:hypothetical protein
MKPFRCGHCQQTVFFENTQCGRCHATLGFVPGERAMAAFQAPEDGSSDGWARLAAAESDEGSGEKADPPADGAPGPAKAAVDGAPPDPALADAEDAPDATVWRACANRLEHGVCNWMLDPADDHRLCLSCRLTQVIPSLDNPRNLEHWGAIERAKRRLVYTLLMLGLTPRPKTGLDDKDGLAFHLLESLPGQAPVLTAHNDGLITLNIAEADDVHREATRISMHEPVRTLLGHFRHEVSHYLQQRYVDDTPGIDTCREVFGDERASYDEALKAYYAEGAPEDWHTRFVSAYASSHPWEDWAETCAHYLLVIDAVETASAWGLELSSAAAATHPVDPTVESVPVESLVLEQWLPVAQFLNAMNRSLGLADAYPYLLPPAVLAKMATVQRLLADSPRARQADTPEIADAAPAPEGAAGEPAATPAVDPLMGRDPNEHRDNATAAAA